MHNGSNFVKEFPNDEKCKAYLAKQKWQDGFKRSKCDGQKRLYKKGAQIPFEKKMSIKIYSGKTEVVLIP